MMVSHLFFRASNEIFRWFVEVVSWSPLTLCVNKLALALALAL